MYQNLGYLLKAESNYLNLTTTWFKGGFLEHYVHGILTLVLLNNVKHIFKMGTRVSRPCGYNNLARCACFVTIGGCDIALQEQIPHLLQRRIATTSHNSPLFSHIPTWYMYTKLDKSKYGVTPLNINIIYRILGHFKWV